MSAIGILVIASLISCVVGLLVGLGFKANLRAEVTHLGLAILRSIIHSFFVLDLAFKNVDKPFELIGVERGLRDEHATGHDSAASCCSLGFFDSGVRQLSSVVSGLGVKRLVARGGEVLVG